MNKINMNSFFFGYLFGFVFSGIIIFFTHKKKLETQEPMVYNLVISCKDNVCDTTFLYDLKKYGHH